MLYSHLPCPKVTLVFHSVSFLPLLLFAEAIKVSRVIFALGWREPLHSHGECGEVLCAVFIVITWSCLPSNQVKSITPKEWVWHNSQWHWISMQAWFNAQKGGLLGNWPQLVGGVQPGPCNLAQPSFLWFSKVTLSCTRPSTFWMIDLRSFNLCSLDSVA